MVSIYYSLWFENRIYALTRFCVWWHSQRRGCLHDVETLHALETRYALETRHDVETRYVLETRHGTSLLCYCQIEPVLQSSILNRREMTLADENKPTFLTNSKN